MGRSRVALVRRVLECVSLPLPPPPPLPLPLQASLALTTPHPPRPGLGPVQASTTALTPLGETPPGGAAAGSGDYALPDEARAYRDEDEGVAWRVGQGENEEEGDWLERLRRRDEQLRRESAQQEEGDK